MKKIVEQLKFYSQGQFSGDDVFFEREYFLPSTFMGFDGHFPGNPIMPAVAQLLLAQVTIAEKTGGEVNLIDIKRAKFVNIVKPDSLIKVLVKPFPEEFSIKYKCTLSVDDEMVSSFILLSDRG